MDKILISACLLGNPVRYDGQAKTLGHAGLDRLVDQQRVVAICPEVAGGLPIPRPAAEIQASNGDAVLAGSARVQTRNGDDVTEYFIAGAELALDLCRQHAIRIAVLTERSPSCGSSLVYDGSFSRNTQPGSGVTSALLEQHGIAVFNQHQIDDAIRRLESCNSKAPPR